MSRMTKKNIIEKTLQIGFFTLLSRVFGFIRQMLMARYLATGITSDAFLTAFRIPNSLRKIFAEGALSAALIPTLVQGVKKDGKDAASKLVTLSFIVIEVILLILCAVIWIYADAVIDFVVPGFSPEQHAPTVPLLKVLIAYIIFISSSAVLAGGLQAVHQFTIPASAPIILNIIFIACLILCSFYNLPVIYLAYGIIFSGIIQTVLHLTGYFHAGLMILRPDTKTWKNFYQVLVKFFPCLITMSIMEINLLIDGQFASYLKPGSITFISYAADFMRIPLGVFAVAFSTILLSHFSRVLVESPKRLSFYLLESIKMVTWVSLPAALLMGFFAYDIFYTTYYSPRFTLYDVQQVSSLLQAFLCGLTFFSLNKILVNIYYAFHQTFIPTLISVCGALINIALNYLFMGSLQAFGLVVATSISAAIQTVLFVVILHAYFNFKIHLRAFCNFLMHYLIQLTFVSTVFYGLYWAIIKAIEANTGSYSHLLLKTFFVWLWVAPLCIITIAALYLTRRIFCIKIYYLK